MASDRARVSFDRSRQWRRVIAQQGRVTVEADWNEAVAIDDFESSEELMDIIGRVGTPDDGYSVSIVGNDVQVGAGTMYVGGERVWIDADVLYGKQLDWEDNAGDPLWVAPGLAPGAQHELVYLLLREQEVSATEARPLREVALGGPDTAQRLRIVQRVVRGKVTSADCKTAWAEQVRDWEAQGLIFTPASMSLQSRTKLRVSFQDVGNAEDPCQPDGHGGYLGAENQLIRVQVSDINSDGLASIIWGYDNASFLYRVSDATFDASTTTTTLTLASRPVDDHHQPRQGQVVEVLRAAADLGDGDHVAASSGFPATLTARYNPDTMQVVLAAALPQEYMDAATPLMFLRVWEQRLACTSGTPIPLGDTGVVVTLETPAGAPFHVGDHWMIAVRPTTPVQVYPQRLLDAPQYADGYRMWACPLAVLGHSNEQLFVESDCRSRFRDLVDLSAQTAGGCCRLTVGPDDVDGGASLQAAIDTVAKDGSGTLCLLPGTYVLPHPLVLDRQHSRMTIEGCDDAAVLETAPDSVDEFVQGMILLLRADGVTLRGLRFRMPQVHFGGSGGKIAGLTGASATRLLSFAQDLYVSIAVRPIHCAQLRIERCLFRFTLPSDPKVSLFAVAVFAASECWGLAIDDCRFLRDEQRQIQLPSERGDGGAPYHVLLGYFLAPSVTFGKGGRRTNVAGTGGTVARSILHDAAIRGSTFEGITVPAIVIADIGTTWVEQNTVRECYGGFWFFAQETMSKVSQLQISTPTDEVAQALRDPVLLFAAVVGRGYPTPALTPTAVAPGQKMPTTNESTRAANALKARWAIDPGSAPAASGAAAETSPLMAELFAAHSSLASFDSIAAAEAGATVQLRLEVASNEVDAVIERSFSSSALMVWDTDAAVGALVLTGNRLRNRAAMRATASVVMVDRATVCGNLITNDMEKGGQTAGARSLLLVPLRQGDRTPLVAVTGNVFVAPDPPVLPDRPGQPAPLNRWEVLNTLG